MGAGEDSWITIVAVWLQLAGIVIYYNIRSYAENIFTILWVCYEKISVNPSSLYENNQLYIIGRQLLVQSQTTVYQD